MPSAATAAPTAAPTSAADGTTVRMDSYKQNLAKEISSRLHDKQFRKTLTAGLSAEGQESLQNLFSSIPGATQAELYTRMADKEILKLKGFKENATPILQIRTPVSMKDQITESNDTLVAFTPSKEDKSITSLLAYDQEGRTHQLDARAAPTYPVLIIGFDERKVSELAGQQARAILAQAGVTGSEVKIAGTAAKSSTADPQSARQVSTIFRVVNYNDHEPWYKGGPEIYAWVMGEGADGSARVDTVEMPYIQTGGKVYSPGQTLIEWGHFKWSSVDVIFMERDDSTDMAPLVRAVIDAALQVSGHNEYIEVADKVLAALPSSATTDTDDWVDSCYNVSAATMTASCAANPAGMGLVLSTHTL